MTADVVGSRRYTKEQRRDIQTRIMDILVILRQTSLAEESEIPDFKARIPGMVTLGMTRGDEWQIVLSSPEAVIEIIRTVEQYTSVELRFGVGIGPIEKTSHDQIPSVMYGRAFSLSRKALEKAEKEDVVICFSTDDEELDFKLNTIMQMILFIKRKMTKRQREILRFLEVDENILLKDVAHRFQVSPQNISKIKKTSGYEEVKRAEDLIRWLLKDYTARIMRQSAE